SRRRHTRFSRDWSSDVCSSDLDPAAVERAITPRTRAVVPVHYAGHPAELDPLFDLAERYGLEVIEDAAHAVPASYRGVMVGSREIGRASCRERGWASVGAGP